MPLRCQATLASLLALMLILSLMVLSHNPGRQESERLTVREALSQIPAPPMAPKTLPIPQPSQHPKPQWSGSQNTSFSLPTLELDLKPKAKHFDHKMPDLTKIDVKQVSPPPEINVFAVDQLDRVPQLLNRPTAQFPQSLLRRGITRGEVTLEVLIDRRGKASVQRIVKSSDSMLEKPAVAAAEQAIFEAPQKNNLPVEALFQWTLVLER